MTFGTNVFAENQQNPRDVTIFGYDPSTAKTYANANNHTFRSFENPESEFLWREVEGGVEIIKYIGSAEVVGIPRQLDQKNVVSIGEDAFYEKKITQVFIPDTVREIKESAFAYNELTEIVIPSSVRTIGEKAFEYNQITEVVLPNSVTKLGAFAFYNNKLTRVVLPNTLTEIEDSVFEENELTSILIPTSVKTIGNNAFAGNKISELSIPLNIETIGNGAFANNELKENLIIPATVKRIGEYTFRDNSLKMVTILNRELEIGGHAFLGNQDYSYDLIIQGYSPSTAEEYANTYEHTFYDLETTTDFQWIDNGDGTATITNYIGSEKDVKIPSALGGLRVTKIGDGAFRQKEIESVTIPKTVLEIGDMAFGINHIKEVNIPDSVQKIGLSAFAINPLEKVTIGKNLESIGDYAFTTLANTLSTIIVDEENESFRSINEKGLYTKDGTKLIQGTNSGEIHPDTKIIGKSAFYYLSFKDGTVMIPNGVEIIEEAAFGSSGITQVMLPETVQRVESYAFADYETKEVVILNNEVILEEKAFQYEDSHVNPSNVTIYGHDPSTAKTYANERGHKFETLDKLFVYNIKQDQTLDIFDYKGTFKHVVIPSKIEGKKVTSISNSTSFGITLGAFSAKGILTVYIPDTVQTIDNFAFMGNYLTKVVIPKSVKRVGNSAFSGNPLLNEVVIENHSMQFGSNVFALGNINPANIIIYGHDPSTAKDYALANGHPFKPIEELGYLFDIETNAAENIISMFNPPLLKQTEVAVESPETSISKIVAMGEFMAHAKTENKTNQNVLSGELPVSVTATNDKDGSQLYAVNNFTPTGVHYATRNTKYTLKLGSHTEVKSTPIALLTDPNAVKNQNMEYNFG